MYKPRDSPPPIYDTTAETAARVILPPAAAFFHARKETFSTNREEQRSRETSRRKGKEERKQIIITRTTRRRKDETKKPHIPQTDAHTTNRNQHRTKQNDALHLFPDPPSLPLFAPWVRLMHSINHVHHDPNTTFHRLQLRRRLLIRAIHSTRMFGSASREI